MVSARYVYAGDGNLVKSIVNGVTTYYVGGIYELEDDGGVETTRKYYSAGGGRIAVRVDGTLNWILSDHLGSTAVTAHEDGTWRGEIYVLHCLPLAAHHMRMIYRSQCQDSNFDDRKGFDPESKVRGYNKKENGQNLVPCRQTSSLRAHSNVHGTTVLHEGIALNYDH